ncbi:hypothetical protein DAPPUDRAFT_336651 [Daphnia pulex]|uniref:Uncharacterized protein n=1 Tax=Daphnia pulex TaxID=6669 RepID=E9I028_DAPPU|nr:hypothetical protein DAPPUDRAFT_336651 [Daphnia pulex]|eukprot:EFX62651.1 hypothetical protein DAPPUDRAFT_336651 [Daphnia pulex]
MERVRNLAENAAALRIFHGLFNSFYNKWNQLLSDSKQPKPPALQRLSIPHSTWIYDDYRMYMMETQSKGCLTAVKDQVSLEPCEMEPHSIKQMWRFDQRNTDYNLRQAYPNITIEEWEFVHEEFRSSPAENLLNIDHIFNWGQLMNKNKNGKTPMCMNNIHGKLNISMEPCQSPGDPMQFPDQLFEYDIDYTIRKFDTNHCLRINEKNAVLKQCYPDSMRWGANEITGQLMDVNSIKCIEFHQGKLRLGLCNDDRNRDIRNGNSKHTTLI